MADGDFADGLSMAQAVAMMGGAEAPSAPAADAGNPPADAPAPPPAEGEPPPEGEPEGGQEPDAKKQNASAARARIALKQKRDALVARETALQEREKAITAKEATAAERVRVLDEAFRLRDYDTVAKTIGHDSWADLMKDVVEREQGKDPDARRQAKRAEEDRVRLERERLQLQTEKTALEQKAQFKAYSASVASELAALETIPRKLVDEKFVDAVVNEQIAALKAGKPKPSAEQAATEVVKRLRKFLHEKQSAWEAFDPKHRDRFDTELGIKKAAPTSVDSATAPPREASRRVAVPAKPAKPLTAAEERAQFARENAHLLRGL